MQPNETVAVVGTGGVGSNVIQVAKTFGAGQIIADGDMRDDKLEAARGLRAAHTVNAAREEAVAAVQTLTSGRGVVVRLKRWACRAV